MFSFRHRPAGSVIQLFRPESMVLAGNGYDEVLTSVSLSAPANGLCQIFPNMTLSSVFLLAGELDKSEASNVPVLSYKSIGLSGFPGPTCTPNAVDIAIVGLRYLVVDHM